MRWAGLEGIVSPLWENGEAMHMIFTCEFGDSSEVQMRSMFF
jgi:hypothetical protein